MRELFGEFVLEREDSPGFAVMVGSAIAHVLVLPYGDDAIITTRAFVATRPRLEPELFGYLLHQNANLIFGAFGLDEEGDVVYDHSILGSRCDKDQLRASVLGVVLAADRFDDEIVRRWGGTRAIDDD
ncbi:MAG: YbjN domain-containing protein [Acidobacteria bacterium]|nr:YbjN domain-containing protein [Acidobacteriota bacterium]